MAHKQAYRERRLRPARGSAELAGGAKGRGRGGISPRLAVYTGGGSSHSWLWFAWLFQRLGCFDVTFLDHDDLAEGALADRQVLAVSGGDTFGIAAALGRPGAAALASFIRQGGMYLGSCAGAYLLLNSSKKPLDLFNWVPAKISNLAGSLPKALQMPEKYCSPYGCSYVYHPVREAVRLTGRGREPWDGAGEFEAPLYGGPAMISPQEEWVLAAYQGFTPRTRYLVEPGLAADTLLGRAAALRCELGQGVCYLCGPHLEHPHYPQANLLLAQAISHELADAAKEEALPPESYFFGVSRERSWLGDLKREISNARVVALALETHPVRWLIGCKIYEPEKLRVFVEAAWQALASLERRPTALLPVGERDLIQAWKEITLAVRRLYGELHKGADALELASALFPRLNQAVAGLLRVLFANLLADSLEDRQVRGAA